MYLTILFLPLVGSLISGLGGRWLGCWGSGLYSTLCVFFSFLMSLVAFYEVGLCGVSYHITLGTWLESGILKVNWGFLFDSITVVMLIVITSVSSLVHLYSIKYMETDPHKPRFMAYLEIFTFFMLLLVTSDNLIQMFLGWEGVGLASYLLINFWFTRLPANQSAIKALVINRVGDFGLTLGILATFWTFQSIDYSVIFAMAPLFNNFSFSFMGSDWHGITLISLFLFIGAVGKSAQLGLHTWLPDAMEGPTPVSALIHAATMVTAGVFLMIRCSLLLEFSPAILCTLLVLGSLTAFFAGMTGIFQNDLKKVIAYSTCSQLGYMIFSCGLSCYEVSLFHLTNHAFFKALLFLSAGSVIHAVSNEQDMRRMGSLVSFLPITYSLMLIGSLSLAGFPFLTGFYSKDFILELTQILNYKNPNFFYISLSFWLGSISVFFTSFYSFRLIYLTFLNNSNLARPLIISVHESPALMLLPLTILALGSLFFGYLSKDLFIGLGTDFWKGSILVLPVNNFFVEAEWLLIINKWLPFILTIVGIFVASIINITSLYKYFVYQTYGLSSFLAFLLNKKWFIDVLYNRFLIFPLLNFGYNTTFKALDRGFIEFSGPLGASMFISNWSKIISRFQSGLLTHYIFFLTIGVCFLFSILTYKNLMFNTNLNMLSIFFILIFYV
uniref:NADH dehydrogenase subunit 5 n=1 Tax=Kappaphycus malesianus TaxID=1408293 RepID=UPI0022383D65|nr:NADH dehydrogenase subunit 5 [Kappaphycus malesianus]UYR20471.1 NADH dehydrogenase subunit 5 [Kappaphycus malesianus]